MKPRRAAINFHCGLIIDWTVNEKGQKQPLGEHGEKLADYWIYKPENFKPYFVSINWKEEGIPTLLPYETRDKYPMVMIVRHGHSVENKEIDKATKAQRDAKKAKNSEGAASSQTGVKKVAPKKK